MTKTGVAMSTKRIAALFLLVIALGAGLLTTSTAFADDGVTAAGVEDSGPRARSFASHFFVARKVVPGSDETRLEILGSFIIWFLLLLSIASLGLIGVMVATNQRRHIIPSGVADETKRLLGQGKYDTAIELTKRDPSFYSRVLGAALGEATHGYGAMIRALEQTADELTTNRLRRIEFLNVLGQVSPMIGLFGTVYGMILAFQSIVVAGGNADPVLLAGGIGTALTTTFWGLVVAIPALAGYAIVRNRIDGLTAEATLVAEEMINQFRPKAKTAK